MTTPSRLNDFHHAEDPAFAKGRLMAVDWANGTARLDTPTGSSVSLRFDISDIDMENKLRRLATCHVDVQGCHIASEECGECEAIRVLEISHAWLKPKPPKETQNGPISDEEWDEFIRVIGEGRSGLCGECRHREPAV